MRCELIVIMFSFQKAICNSKRRPCNSCLDILLISLRQNLLATQPQLLSHSPDHLPDSLTRRAVRVCGQKALPKVACHANPRVQRYSAQKRDVLILRQPPCAARTRAEDLRFVFAPGTHEAGHILHDSEDRY